MSNRRKTLIKLSRAAICCALMAVCSWIVIPLPAVPITLQTFAVCAAAGILGAKWGCAATLSYIAMGLAGLPVFSGFGAGVGVLMGAGGGYILGFIPLTLIVGAVSRRYGKRFLPLLMAMGAGTLTCYLIGVLWFCFAYGDSGSFVGAIVTCVVPYLIPDVMKMILAAALVVRLKPVIGEE